ncbi:MAG: hypothetical protein MUC76_00155 [Spirochaetes bacterium]|jgi:hypothetical protein|nr:hypothetical protein [Spirochaetota bacterium]
MNIPVLLDILVGNNELTPEQARRSLAIQRDSNKLMGMILVEEGYITGEVLCKYLSKEYEAAFDPRTPD